MTLAKKLRLFLLENTSLNQTIAKNAIWLFAGQFVSRLSRAVIVIYAARALGVASWGAFAYALGVITFLTVFSDIGINGLITRESAQRPELKHQYLSTAFFIKLGLLILTLIAITIALPYLSKIEEARALIPILFLVFAFDAIRDLGAAICRALEKMQIEAGLQILTNVAIAAFGVLFLTLFGTSRALAYGYVIGSGIGFLAALYVLRNYFSNLTGNFRKNLVGRIIKTAWPFGLLGIMGIMMLNTDIIMLGLLRTPEEVGYYAAAQKLIQLLYVVPALVGFSLFPALSKLLESNRERAREILGKVLALVILISIPIAILGISLAPLIIKLVFGGEYLASIAAFRILMFSVLIVYPSSILGQSIFAYNQQAQFIGLVTLTIVGNVIFNFLLIPKFGILGAAAATLIVQLITNILLWIKIKRISQLRIWPQVKKYWRAKAN